MKQAIDLVLSGEYELCVPQERWGESFLRNSSFRVNGEWTQTISIPVEEQVAKEIADHACVVVKFQGALTHYATRSFPKGGSI